MRLKLMHTCPHSKVISGAIAGMFSQGADGYPPQAYRLIFAFLALALGTGILIYARVKDLKPRP